MSNSGHTLPTTLAMTPQLNRWVSFADDGTVTVRTGKVELGQGIVSAIAQIAAEELDVEYARIRMVPANTTLNPNEKSTSGSRSIQEGGESMRQACAEVRALMLERAAEVLEAPLDSLTIQDGIISTSLNRRTTSYWGLKEQINLSVAATGRARPKRPGECGIVGKSLKRLDIQSKITGAAFIQDLDFPGMLHARIIRPPSYWGKLLAFDQTVLENLPGHVQAICAGSFLAVVADREDTAIRAMKKLSASCTWDQPGLLPDENALPAFLLSQETEDELLCDEKTAGLHQSGEKVSRLYTKPYIAQASIAPSCSIGWHNDGTTRVWTHSQSIYELRNDIARVLGIEAQQLELMHAESSGCYGHNGADDVALDAALLARILPGKPVRVQWMREDEFAWEPFGPAMAVKIEGALTPDGLIAEWDEQIWGNRHISRPGRQPSPGLLSAWYLEQGFDQPAAVDMPLEMGGGSQRNAVPYYHFAVKRVTNHAVKAMPVRTSALRALGAYLNVFAIESFMDEMASKAGQDPVHFKLAHVKDARARHIIQRAAELASWHTPLPHEHAPRGKGFAFARYKNMGSYAAVVVEVEVDQAVHVNKVYAAVDCGRVVNPDGVINQIEGGIIQSISWTLKERVRFDRERITSIDWESYPILTFSEVPDIEIDLIDQPNQSSLGIGESLTGPVAAAIANAVHNAIGVRVPHLPLTYEQIVKAIHEA
jgi:nicotinate dehydrogenase subunit B